MKRWIGWSVWSSWLLLTACGSLWGPNRPPAVEPARDIPMVTERPSPTVTVEPFVLTPTIPSMAPGESYPSPSVTPSPEACAPTPPDALGPFYKPGAPVRDRVGQGHVLRGVVRSSADCAPIAGAQIEFWLAGPDGRYADAYRATVFAGPDGTYRFESHFPPAYSGRPPHIHIRVTAPGYQTLVTQYYPQPGQTDGILDLVLIPTR
ncbi:hypothetical protein [Thermoflexus sp.]|uniref:hypothetical protein n=1 Tax=Thermoflexus sp. TaxID=1969742 RepID=UPI002ADE49C2|nr:hypothetical protein [Thermoflexus sp.]